MWWLACAVDSAAPEVDEDADGWSVDAGDCDDLDPATHPAADESCDGLDNDCDAEVDEGLTRTLQADADGDGWGDPERQVSGCDPAGVEDGSDCDDADATVHPRAVEDCDLVDDDCDGEVDEGVESTWYADPDGDGFGDEAVVYVGCDPGGWASVGGDCGEGDAGVHPGAAEDCDEVDDDCDGEVDEGVETEHWADDDGDGAGDASRRSSWACVAPEGWVDNADDCDDDDPGIHAGAAEDCDYVDDDCDGEVDEDLPVSTWYRDFDGDGHGWASTTLEDCAQPEGYVATADDCADREPDAWTDRAEICDGLDNDCNGVRDEGITEVWFTDADGDGRGDPYSWEVSCDPDPGAVTSDDDCDDADPSAWDGAPEWCDGIDNDCDGETDEEGGASWTLDLDGDGWGDDSTAVSTCAPSGAEWVAQGGDCDPLDPDISPGAAERCDGVDQDCDGVVDDDPVDGLAPDADGDGFGDALAGRSDCAGVDNAFDCDDSDPEEPVVVDDDATGSADGSLAAPYAEIQTAIVQSEACVVVLPGFYQPIDFLGKDLLVLGAYGPFFTVIDATGEGSAASFHAGESPAAELRGFTLTRGGGTLSTTVEVTECGSSASCTVTTERWMGGGVWIDGAAPTLEQLVVVWSELPDYQVEVVDIETERHSYSYGGGIFVQDSDAYGELSLHNVFVLRNTAVWGGGIYVGEGSTLRYRQGRIVDNRADSEGGGVFVGPGGVAALSNALVVDNSASEVGGGVEVTDGELSVENLTLLSNLAADGAGIAAFGTAELSVLNSIVSASEGGGVWVDASASASFRYTNVYGSSTLNYDNMTDPTGTEGNISEPTEFRWWNAVDTFADDDDLRLRVGDASIDAGDPDAAYDDVDGTRNDLGAYGGPGGSW